MTVEGSVSEGGSADRAHDPFAPIEAGPRGAVALLAVAVALSAAALVAGLAPLAGPLAMGTALVAHVKGHRAGMPIAWFAGVSTIIGMTFTLYLR
jgi:hypothetical protein